MAFTGHGVGHTGHGAGQTGHAAGHAGHAFGDPGGLEAYAGAQPMLADGLTQPLSEQWLFNPIGIPEGNSERGAFRNEFVWNERPSINREVAFFRSGEEQRRGVYLTELLSAFKISKRVRSRVANVSIAVMNGGIECPMIKMIAPPIGVFQGQLRKIWGQSIDRRMRAAEILSQTASGAAVWAAIVGLDQTRFRFTIEFINAVLDATTPIVYRLKQEFACRRPFEYTPQIRPMIATPTHYTWPSGHSTEAHVTATLLQNIAAKSNGMDVSFLNGITTLANEAAARIARNREVAGLHFPVDSAAGRVLGVTIANFCFAAAFRDAEARKMVFNGTALNPVELSALDTDMSAFQAGGDPIGFNEAVDADRFRYLRLLAGKVAAEWS